NKLFQHFFKKSCGMAVKKLLFFADRGTRVGIRPLLVYGRRILWQHDILFFPRFIIFIHHVSWPETSAD
ncbi:MAG: hypothetical protein WCH99_18965, partial [Verrucomicrobiota bacterium]